MKKYFQVLENFIKTKSQYLLSAVLLMFLCTLVAFALYIRQESRAQIPRFIVCFNKTLLAADEEEDHGEEDEGKVDGFGPEVFLMEG